MILQVLSILSDHLWLTGTLPSYVPLRELAEILLKEEYSKEQHATKCHNHWS